MDATGESLQQRDAAAWNAFYEEHAQEIYGFLVRLVPAGRPAVDELFQDVWLQACKDIDRFDPNRGELRTWLFAIARQRVALYWRQRSGRNDAESLNLQGSEFEVGDDALLPSDVLEEVERAAAVNAALLVLPADRRNVLVQKYVEGRSVQQIAEQCGKSAKSVESLLTRGRNQLRSMLRQYFGDVVRGTKK